MFKHGYLLICSLYLLVAIFNWYHSRIRATPHFCYAFLHKVASHLAFYWQVQISQDGHGMLPMLAESRRSFLAVKIVNMIYVFIVGLSTLLLGF